MIKTNSYSNVAILAIANAFAFASVPLLIFTASLVGAQLAPIEDLATAPVAACIIGIATGIWPASKVTFRFGRKTSFIFFYGWELPPAFWHHRVLQRKTFISLLPALFYLVFLAPQHNSFAMQLLSAWSRKKRQPLLQLY